MKNQLQHTPTPWKIADDNVTKNEINIGRKGYLSSAVYGCSIEEQEANARFIVRAVNCHEELIKTLRTLVAMPSIQGHALVLIKQTLAKAEGE